MKAIVANSLTKTFPTGKTAVDNMNIEIEQGEIFGFLGPNGAGKTTTIKLLNGMLRPTRGYCRVFDIDPTNNAVEQHRFSGVVTEHAQMYDTMTGVQNLMFYGAMFGMDAAESKKRGNTLLEALGLSDAMERKLGTYSTGMRQRLSLARAMMHKPKILFLDEPTAGLDPESAYNVNNMITGLARVEGATIFLCTHQLRYAQEICTSYGLLDEGRLLASGDLLELRRQVFPGLTVRIQADRFPGHLSADKVAGYYQLRVRSEDEIPDIVRSVVEMGGSVYHVSAQRLTLEEIYFALIEQHKNGKGGAQ